MQPRILPTTAWRLQSASQAPTTGVPCCGVSASAVKGLTRQVTRVTRKAPQKRPMHSAQRLLVGERHVQDKKARVITSTAPQGSLRAVQSLATKRMNRQPPLGVRTALGASPAAKPRARRTAGVSPAPCVIRAPKPCIAITRATA